MKTKITIPCFVALLLCAGCAHTPQNADGAGATTTHQVTTRTGEATVVVTFNNPENFTDVKSSMMGSDKDRDSLLEELRDYVVEQAPRFLNGGQTFAITFNDIDMAGDFEPNRGPGLQDVRIVREIWPPRIALDFSLSLKSAGGAEIAGGTRRLTDLAFMNVIPAGGVFRDDRLRHEKMLLFNWLSGEVASLSRAAPAGGGK